MQSKDNNKKQQLSLRRLLVVLLILVGVWALCIKGQEQFAQRFQEENINRMGANSISKEKLALAIQIKDKENQIQKELAMKKYDNLLQKKYNLKENDPQRMVCILVRDFQTEGQQDADHLTIQSILNQDYKSWSIFYLSQKNDPSVPKVKSFLEFKKVDSKKYNFVTANSDAIQALQVGLQKCPPQSIVMLLQNKERLTSKNILKTINSQFATQGTELVWGSSLYKNNKIGFSFDYNPTIKEKKNYRDYPFPAEDIVLFKRQLLMQNKAHFIQYRLMNPLFITSSYGYFMMQKAKRSQYISQILTIKPRNYLPRSQRSQIQKDLQQKIRKDESIILILQNYKKKSS